MKRLRKFLNLTHSDRHLLISTFILLTLVRLGLWLLPFKRLWQILSAISQVRVKPQPVDRTDLDKIVKAVDLSSRYMPGGVKCLARAFTTQVLMKRYGYSPELRIGVAKKEGGELEAHAWVESQGKVVIGYLRDLSSFTPLPPVEGAERL
ncbi:MAG: lasso peptide biosynthesis B2 protein [Nostoc sp. TH1S01]|nr:lasso peptide biosynthesis B2 protein [Nostoc sp. TH1S01]